ncbi:RecB family exonuclease [Actinomycetospora termitidis]|uniref:PD-(D/E)XK nuclease family protein n=1 Tax=Actinomycetospora termitidis TaxID=3053470 RepID=A0ABT7MBD1_9PSEU|nr:PD-(D/E)XK nuclease family protein [Actinomycetospora sp. Odt1-22]MDL5157317.1 PD-(D/E)XK nuclease family protein [Actinomycetospora sp. Odt1-22]
MTPMSGQLSLADMPLPLVKVTPARLATWDGCRRRFRMTYLDRPTPPRGGAWAHATLGAVVHNVLRAVYETPAARRSPETAARLVDTLWSDEGFRDSDQAAGYRTRAREWVGRYVAETEVGEPLGVERWVTAPVGDIVAEGRVDRIDAGPRDEAVIVDYKTGRGVPTSEDARASRALALYALAAGRTLRRACRRVELHHLPSGTVAVAEHDETSLARHRHGAERSARAMADAGDALGGGGDPEVLFPPTTGPGCARCDFRRSCPEGRAASPSLRPWSLLAP